MKSEDGTGGRHPLLGDVDCHPPISFNIKRAVAHATALVLHIFLLAVQLFLHHRKLKYNLEKISIHS